MEKPVMTLDEFSERIMKPAVEVLFARVALDRAEAAYAEARASLTPSYSSTPKRTRSQPRST